MGRVTVRAKIENLADLSFVEKGILRPEDVHRCEVSDALVDTGSTYLAMPRQTIEQLGFKDPFTKTNAKTARGSVLSNVYGPVRLTIDDRSCNVDIAEVDDGCPVLIGQVPLQLLDFVVDPRERKLIGRHGDQQMIELY